MFKIECLSDIQKSYLCNMKIYFINGIDVFDENFIEQCSSFFPKWRRDKMLSYKFLKGRVQSALAYLLLIYALRKEGVFVDMPEFYYGEHKKPYLKNYPGWHFNLSHCKDAVCCVLSHEEVGIDIEKIGEYKENLAAYISNEEELEQLHNSDNQTDDFYKLWTEKEAVFKLLGSGITKDIKNILNKDKNIVVDSYKIGDMWLSVSYNN
jgi:4'-phosphopantetheinyl transferase